MGNTMNELADALVAKGILHKQSIINAFRRIDRKNFVPDELKDRAYDDEPLPIGAGQTISQPSTVGFMLELLDPRPGNSVLDIGSGSGWQTALLADIVGKNGTVNAYERIGMLYNLGRKNVGKYEFISQRRVSLHKGDATKIQKGTYDRIIAAAALDGDPPSGWMKILRVGGRMVVPVGNSLILYIKTGPDTYETEEYPGFVFVPLIADGKGGSWGQKFFFRGAACLLVFFFLFMAYELGIIFPPLPAQGEPFIIQEGSFAGDIAELLKTRNVIRSKELFVWTAYLVGAHNNLSSGTFLFLEPESIFTVIRELTRKREEIQLVIPEGVTIRDIVRILEKNKMPAAKNFIQVTNKVPEDFPFESLEGFLFPDTYRVYVSTSAEDLVQMMLKNFHEKTDPLRAEVESSPRSLYEIITMASLVEKEVPTRKDKEIVAGVLWKRIDDKYPLQIDATLFYESGKASHELSLGDLREDTPYNTYVHVGLPPSPIANPGFESIEAALRPKGSPYYFYLSDRRGTTHFARTFEEHKLNKAKYLR
ncbi:MAG: Aminodeoxychorismate lyase [Parcubacteria group bacterium GW2011_GWA2_47_10b]|nr:MAG: Aminodeoxychorismate lyase [Parcubacteria group bacterium GW2011_GWA2_47_10b]